MGGNDELFYLDITPTSDTSLEDLARWLDLIYSKHLRADGAAVVGEQVLTLIAAQLRRHAAGNTPGQHEARATENRIAGTLCTLAFKNLPAVDVELAVSAGAACADGEDWTGPSGDWGRRQARVLMGKDPDEEGA